MYAHSAIGHGDRACAALHVRYVECLTLPLYAIVFTSGKLARAPTIGHDVAFGRPLSAKALRLRARRSRRVGFLEVDLGVAAAIDFWQADAEVRHPCTNAQHMAKKAMTENKRLTAASTALCWQESSHRRHTTHDVSQRRPSRRLTQNHQSSCVLCARPPRSMSQSEAKANLTWRWSPIGTGRQ